MTTGRGEKKAVTKLPPPEDFYERSLKRHLISQRPIDQVMEYADSWMREFDLRASNPSASSQAPNAGGGGAEGEGKDDDGGGWTLVQRGGSKGTNVAGGAKVMKKGFEGKEKTRRGKGNKSEGVVGFYKYEHKKATDERLAGIREKLKGDVERMKKGRVERKFKPY
ncbi:hypothetical protein BT69DRAFT_1336177 [Atractiella rhizophila]|nr:hypothetical protein BT69DRAFT_1336177 [Atractiella rhizophila]